MENEIKANDSLPSEAKADKLIAWLEEKKALDITAIDVRGISSITDYMIMVSANNKRHGRSLADWILKQVSDHGMEYLGMEGYANSTWILIDLNDILIHIFQREEREMYDIEGLWSEGKIFYEKNTEGLVK